MTIDQLKTNLEKKYSIKAMIDLSDLSKSPQAAYQFFQSIHQPEYQDNDRIVLYTSVEIPDKFLKHLHQVINFVDISNWFILMCTNSMFVNKANEYSTDLVAFQHLKIPLEQTSEFSDQYILPETICAIPWMNIELRSNGDITPCCMSSGVSLGNINNDTIDDAFNSDALQTLRKQLLNGEKPKACNSCWKNEERGLTSIRMHNIKRLKNLFLLKYLEKPEIASIDLKFNNTCNFKCRICNPTSSSLVASEQKKFLKINIPAQVNWAESSMFADQMISKLPQLTNIDMFGGEPFLIKKFTNVLRVAVDQGYAKNIRLHYNSNGSIWPEEFIPYWKHFKEVDIHFSIDAVGQRFELQRGGSWKDVESNILQIKNLNFSNMTINLMPTINIMSVYYIDEVYQWAKKHGFNIFLSNLVNPEYYNIKNITAEMQQLVIEKFKNHPNQEIQNILKTVRSITPTDGMIFRNQTAWFDSIRKENFTKSHPEIADAMGYVYNKSYDSN
jgi:radical SAM protein with 4Fe4S-binding SPASM domain